MALRFITHQPGENTMPSPEFQAAVQRIRNAPMPGADLTPDERRRLYEQESQYPMPPGATATPVIANGVPCEWVIAPGADPALRLLYLHGGGYVIGNLNTHRDMAAILSQETGASALTVDYRLAPEHPFPAAVEDALAAYRFILSVGPQGPADAGAVFIAGDSAGGGLSLATAIAARDADDRLPDAVVAISAWTDLSQSGNSYDTRRDADIRLAKAGVDAMAAAYLGDADPRTPLASPLFADLRGLPPLLLQVGDAEIVLDDTRAFTRRAREAGVDVSEEIWPDAFHVWHHQWATVPESMEAVRRIGDFCKRHATSAAGQPAS
jgi:monoterpene epsilon-lactone hydrolase